MHGPRPRLFPGPDLGWRIGAQLNERTNELHPPLDWVPTILNPARGRRRRTKRRNQSTSDGEK
uniref:Uncharacterized protein n=1 Tax=Arundo donax TaxID=35708 RepID=A0A0A9ECW4_ARUDO